MVMIISCAWRTPRRIELWAGLTSQEMGFAWQSCRQAGLAPWTNSRPVYTRNQRQNQRESGSGPGGRRRFLHSHRGEPRALFSGPSRSVRGRTVLVAPIGLSRALHRYFM